MKRMWIGAGLLAALLAAGLLTARFTERRILPQAQTLRRAGAFALAGEWEKAEALTGAVRAEWEGLRPLASALTAHEKAGQIDTAFAQLSACRGDGPAYCALCITLAADLEGIAGVHAGSWENFF